MMLEFDDHLRQDAERRLVDLRAMPSAIAIERVRTWMLGNQRSRGELNGHLVEADEGVEYGGTDTAPTPLSYLLASLGFCEQTMIARWACRNDIGLEEVAIDVKGYWNRKGGHVDGFEPTGFERFRVQVSVVSPASAEVIRKMMQDVERQCYVFNTLRRCAQIEHTIVQNGETIMKTVTGKSPSDES